MSFLESIWSYLVKCLGRENAKYIAITAAAAIAGAGATAAGEGPGAVLAAVLAAAMVIVTVTVAAVTVGAVAGAATGTVVGAATGTVFLLSFFGLQGFAFPPIFYLASIIILAELFYWKSKRKPGKKESRFWFVAKEKIRYLAESAFWILEANGLHNFSMWLIDYFNMSLGPIEAAIYFVELSIIVIMLVTLFLFLYIKGSELKFRGKSQ